MKENRRAYGSGTTYQKENGKWIAQSTIEFDGKKKKISGTGDTETKAIRKRNENVKKYEENQKELKELCLLEEKQKEENSNKVGTLNEAIEKDLQTIYMGVTPTTRDSYETFYKGYIKDSNIGKKSLSEIKEEDLNDFYNNLFRSGNKRTKEGLHVDTVNSVRYLIRATIKRAYEDDIIIKDVHKRIRKYTKEMAIAMNPKNLEPERKK